MNAWALLAMLVFCAGCRRAPQPQPQAPTPPPADRSEASPLATPVTAPMAARDRLLNDLGRQKQLARERAEVFEAATGERDR
jgi:hypothetical protein